MNVNRCHFFPRGGIQFHTLSSPTLPLSDVILSDCPSAAICHTPQNVMGCWQKGSTSTAISPTSTSDIVGQCDNIRGITLRTAFIALWLFIHIEKSLMSLRNKECRPREFATNFTEKSLFSLSKEITQSIGKVFPNHIFKVKAKWLHFR